MKQAFIIETDSDMDTVFLYEAEVTYSVLQGRWTAIRGEKIINRIPDAQFYGILNSLLITQSRMEKRFAGVKPITPGPPRPIRETESLAETVEKVMARNGEL